MVRDYGGPRSGGKGPEYQDSVGYRKLLEQYADVVAQGYKFETNASKESLGELARGLRERGLEVEVGQVTFSPDGRENPAAGVIFTKPKQEAQE